MCIFFCFKQTAAYEMRISDWSSDVCSSDLYRFPTLVRNTPVLEEAATSRAVFNLVPSHDGVVRSVPAFVVAEGRIIPSLAAELLRVDRKSTRLNSSH